VIIKSAKNWIKVINFKSLHLTNTWSYLQQSEYRINQMEWSSFSESKILSPSQKALPFNCTPYSKTTAPTGSYPQPDKSLIPYPTLPHQRDHDVESDGEAV
jgi:hypothetical protein